MKASRINRATVNHDAGAIEATHRNNRARHVLITAHHRNIRIVPMGGHYCFDGIGDDLARLQGEIHAFGAHRNSITHADSMEHQTHTT